MMDRELLRQRYLGVQERVRNAVSRSAYGQDVTLIVASKTQSEEVIQVLYELGQRDFGENYVQDLASKAGSLEERGYSGIRWHFIGHLQTNKVKALIPYVASVHSVDSEKLVAELSKRWREAGRVGKLPVFIEVNIDHESTKTGLPLEGLSRLALRIWETPELSLEGLMCIPSAPARGAVGVQSKQEAFERLRSLDSKCRPWTRNQLSMGMSADFEMAISMGATHVRVGTAIFGERETT